MCVALLCYQIPLEALLLGQGCPYVLAGNQKLLSGPNFEWIVNYICTKKNWHQIG